MLKVRPQGPTFKSRSRGYPELARSAGKSRAMIGSAGSTANGSGTENTTFASIWPTCRLMAKSEKDWSIDFAKCITSVNGAGIAENHNRSLDKFCRGFDPEPSVLTSATISRGHSDRRRVFRRPSCRPSASRVLARQSSWGIRNTHTLV